MRRIFASVAVAGALLFAAARALAQLPHESTENTRSLDESARRDQAKTLFERGVALYRDEHYKEALNYFLGAQNLYANTTLTFNIARTCERLRDAPCALKNYRDYRRKARDAKDLNDVEQHIAALERDIARDGLQQITVFSEPAGAKLTVDGVEKGLTPWTGELSPGQHTAVITQAGFEDVQVAFLVDAAHAADLTYDLRPARPPTEVRPEPAPIAPQPAVAAIVPLRPAAPVAESAPARPLQIAPLTWVALGSGVLALGTAGVLESLRANRESDVRNQATQLDREAAYESMKDYQKAARITAGAGLALTTVGCTLLALDLTRHPQNRTSASAWCTGADCRVILSGAW